MPLKIDPQPIRPGSRRTTIMERLPPPPATCQQCGRPGKARCEGGEMVYLDGSSRICPNWSLKLDEIGGMTPEKAEEQARFDRLCR